MKTLVVIKEILILSCLAFIIYWLLFMHNSHDKVVSTKYIVGKTKSDTLFPNKDSVFNFVTNEINHRHYHYYIATSAGVGGSIISDTNTCIKDTFQDQRLQIFTKETFKGKTILLNRDLSYKLFVPEVINNLRVDTVKITLKQAQKRWVIGPALGVGVSSNGFQPYVGIGIQYKLFEF